MTSKFVTKSGERVLLGFKDALHNQIEKHIAVDDFTLNMRPYGVFFG